MARGKDCSKCKFDPRNDAPSSKPSAILCFVFRRWETRRTVIPIARRSGLSESLRGSEPRERWFREFRLGLQACRCRHPRARIPRCFPTKPCRRSSVLLERKDPTRGVGSRNHPPMRVTRRTASDAHGVHVCATWSFLLIRETIERASFVPREGARDEAASTSCTSETGWRNPRRDIGRSHGKGRRRMEGSERKLDSVSMVRRRARAMEWCNASLGTKRNACDDVGPTTDLGYRYLLA